MDSPFMGGRMADSPYLGRVQDSPFLRAQEAKYGQAYGFSLGPGMHEAGASEGSGGAVDTPQSTADLTAFVQNLLQQMQLRFQTMSDAIIGRIDEMASRIEDLEKAVDEVLKEVTADDDGALPSPSTSPMRKPLAAPPSPDVRKLMSGSGSFSGVPSSPSLTKYPSTGTPEVRRQVSSAASYGGPGPGTAPKSPDPRRHSSQSLYIPNSPDPRRHSATGVYGSQGVANAPDVRRQTLPGTYVPTSPDVRKNVGVQGTNVPTSPDPRRRSDTYSTGMR